MSDFDTLVNKVISREGGYVNNPADRGGETKHGISKRAYPHLDIANLSREQAVQIYKTDYWDKLGGDKLPENVRDLAFDTAVHHGVATARSWVASTGADPSRLLAVRTKALEAQAAKDPSQQVFLAGWKKRLAEFGQPAAIPSPQDVPLRPDVPRNEAGLREALAAQVAAVKAEPSPLVKLGAGIAGNVDNRFVDSIRERLSGIRGEFDQAAEAGYKVPDEYLVNITQAVQDERNEARSDKELKHILARQDNENFRLKTMAASGPWSGFAYAMGGELASISNVFAPLAAARVMAMGTALKAARAAHASAAAAPALRTNVIARSVQESLYGGTAVELSAQLAEGRWDPANAGISALADIAFGGLSGASALRTANLQRVMEDAALREVQTFEKAATNVGPGAKPEEIEAEYQRIRHEEIKQPLATAISPVSSRAKLMEHPEEAVDGAEGDLFKVAEQPVPEAPPATQALDFKPEGKVLVAEFSNGQGGKGDIELSEADGRVFPSMVDNGLPPGQSSGKIVKAHEVVHAATGRLIAATGKLPADLAGAKPRYSYGNKQFELAFESDLDKALYIIAQAKPSKRDEDYARFALSELGLEASDLPRLRSLGQEVRKEIKALAKGSNDPVIFYSKRGYSVEKNPSARLATKPEALTDRWVTDDGAPVYTVGAKGKPMQGPAPEALPVRQAIAQALESPALRGVNETSRATRHLLTHLQKTLPVHVLDKVKVKFEGNVRGAYNPIDNDISTPGSSADTLSPDGYGNRNDANVLGHEVVHAATGRLIAAVRDNVPGVSAGSKAAVKRLEEIRLELDAHLRAKGIRQPKRGAGADYAASDLDEFVAQVMSDVETRKALAELPAKGFKDLLSAFADAVIRLLGLDPKTNNSALKEAVALVDKIIREGEIVQGANAGTYIKTKPGLQGPAPQTPAQSATAFSTDPIALKYGLTGLPIGTSAERAKAKAILNLYKKADEWAIKYPMDEAWIKRADNLIDNSVFSLASTGLTMLKSKNPVARMIASELLEDASGVQGKRFNTAAISKYMHERLFLGNSLPEFMRAYKAWSKEAGGSFKEDAWGGTYLKRFNDLVAEEIELRRTGRSANTHPSVKAAADAAEGVYTRTAKAERDNKTLGWGAIPESSVGYMPHRVSPGKWRALSNEHKQVIHDALTDQFITIEGWDASFSDQLASRYLQRVQARANGGHDAPIGGASAGSAEIVEDALLSMGMARDEVRKNMERFNRGAAGWTKSRLDLDLLKTYDVGGETFRLLDIFDTDQIALMRSRAGRASGEVALARKGVYGRPGLQLIRDSLEYGEDGARGTDEVLRAFDQVSAEFMNAPFGTALPKILERAMILNATVRLGGVVYNQFAEFSNQIAHLGVSRTMSAMGSMFRLRQEIKAKVAGKPIKNGLLDSSELLGGAEFGTDAYKIVLPFDSPDAHYPVYGVDTVAHADRLLRGLSYAQGKLSLWRAVHSAQERGTAEQIVAKIARYSRDGLEDKALLGFGITPEMRKAIIDDGVAKWDSAGSLLEFDVTKFKDQAMAEDVVQAVFRGTKQIIQGTFIGETGKWVHEGYLKLLTQFRGYSLTAMEKQWGRQRNSHGTWKTLGIMLGSMSVVLPVYTARVYAASLGREDADEYIEKRMAPEMVARQLMNYIALSNVAPDFLDVAAALAPDEYGVKMTGGRVGADTDFVGNLVAPSLSLVDDVWKAFQNLDDPSKLVNVLPGNNLFYAVPAINALEALDE